jgi:hypothetical protein
MVVIPGTGCDTYLIFYPSLLVYFIILESNDIVLSIRYLREVLTAKWSNDSTVFIKATRDGGIYSYYASETNDFVSPIDTIFHSIFL